MRKDLSDQLEAKKNEVRRQMNTLTPSPMGHAFLWGVVEVKLKNGKAKRVRCCLTSVCTNDLEEACRRAASVQGVSQVSYNLD